MKTSSAAVKEISEINWIKCKCAYLDPYRCIVAFLLAQLRPVVLIIIIISSSIIISVTSVIIIIISTLQKNPKNLQKVW